MTTTELSVLQDRMLKARFAAKHGGERTQWAAWYAEDVWSIQAELVATRSLISVVRSHVAKKHDQFDELSEALAALDALSPCANCGKPTAPGSGSYLHDVCQT